MGGVTAKGAKSLGTPEETGWTDPSLPTWCTSFGSSLPALEPVKLDVPNGFVTFLTCRRRRAAPRCWMQVKFTPTTSLTPCFKIQRASFPKCSSRRGNKRRRLWWRQLNRWVLPAEQNSERLFCQLTWWRRLSRRTTADPVTASQTDTWRRRTVTWSSSRRRCEAPPERRPRRTLVDSPSAQEAWDHCCKNYLFIVFHWCLEEI